ncbi:hypothetical protein EJ05DRAFT_500263 [Pseudovirgaria hyperparasitica]|uniref:Uncharacterized protein n=1 Tax=Pseudovirgaria hyperparasitica TaxID=470096 RepID=A0A6A6W9N6_9PEZI|nr:uncharacterized protein EJ05DRAFT_500263 [Pseudovirgaria hyperparasitica]KAF2758744.1 hypothetical protein EJ05DRAFT_500263 [Pseudovirgaria hyperparasitica]
MNIFRISHSIARPLATTRPNLRNFAPQRNLIQTAMNTQQRSITTTNVWLAKNASKRPAASSTKPTLRAKAVRLPEPLMHSQKKGHIKHTSPGPPVLSNFRKYSCEALSFALTTTASFIVVSFGLYVADPLGLREAKQDCPGTETRDDNQALDEVDTLVLREKERDRLITEIRNARLALLKLKADLLRARVLHSQMANRVGNEESLRGYGRFGKARDGREWLKKDERRLEEMMGREDVLERDIVEKEKRLREIKE